MTVLVCVSTEPFVTYNYKHMCTVVFGNITTIPPDWQVSSHSRGGHALLMTMFLSSCMSSLKRHNRHLFSKRLAEMDKFLISFIYMKLTTRTCLVTVFFVTCTSDTFCARHSWTRYQSIAMVTEVVAGASDRVFTFICICIFTPFVPKYKYLIVCVVPWEVIDPSDS